MLSPNYEFQSKESARILLNNIPLVYEQNYELQVELQAKNNDDQNYELEYLSDNNLLKPSSTVTRYFQKLKTSLQYVSRRNEEKQNTLSLRSSSQIYPIMLSHDQFAITDSLYKDKDGCTPQSQGNHNDAYANLMRCINISKFIHKVTKNVYKKKIITDVHISLLGDNASDSQLFLQSIMKSQIPGLGNMLRILTSRSGDRSPKKISLKVNLKLKMKNGVISMINFIQTTIDRLPLVTPGSGFKFGWDIWTTLFRGIFFILIPIEIGFQPEILFGKLLPLTIIMLIIFILDLAVRVNTICYVSGIAVKDRWQIFIIQLKKSIVTDTVSLFPLLLQIFISHQVLRLLSLLFFLQYDYVTKVIEQLQDRLHLNKRQSLLNLMKLIGALIYILHIFSCLWFYVSSHESDYNWIDSKELVGQQWQVQYLEAFYYATVTMLTIGYGDSVPQTHVEKIIAIFYMLIACQWMSYSVNVVGNILKDMKKHTQKAQQKMRILNRYMKRKNISFGLQYKIREYLNYCWEEQVDSEFGFGQQEDIINQLSDGLRGELLEQAYYDFIHQCPLFKNLFSQQFKKKLTPLIKSMLLQPETGFDASLQCKDDVYLCFVDMGTITQLPGSNFTTHIPQLPTLKHGETFGIIEFVKGRLDFNSQCYRASGFAQILHISRNEFLNVIKEFPDDYETFNNLKDNAESENYHSNFTKCPSCNQNNHQFSLCPLIHLIPDRELVIKRHQFQKQQFRKQYKRSNKRMRSNYHALKDSEVINEFAGIFAEDQQQLINAQCKLQVDYDHEDNISMSQKRIDTTYDEQEEQDDLLAPRNSESSITHRPFFSTLGVRNSCIPPVTKAFQETNFNNPLDSFSQMNSTNSPLRKRVSTLNRSRTKESLQLITINNHLESMIKSPPNQDNHDDQLQLYSIEDFQRKSIMKNARLSQNTLRLVNKKVLKIQVHKPIQDIDQSQNPSTDLITLFNNQQYLNINHLVEKFKANQMDYYDLDVLLIKLTKCYFHDDNLQETMQNYKIYMPTHNLSHQIDEQNLRINYDLKPLRKYLFYPLDFLIRYKKNIKYDISTIQQKSRQDVITPSKRKQRQNTLAQAMVRLKTTKSPSTFKKDKKMNIIL